MSKQALADQHSFLQDAVFRLKGHVHTVRRFIDNWQKPVKKYSLGNSLKHQPVIAFSESDLWNPNDNQENWILTAGKIENLRIAVRKLNGLEVKANEVFSFWKHIGNPNIGQGFVIGREIREGCIVPTVAGGLCQLSNALYDAALNAGFNIVERHRHTKIIKGSLAEKGRDATVKWNYIDLRFKSPFDFRIEVELTTDKLIVSFRSIQKSKDTLDTNLHFFTPAKLNDCYSCGNLSCFKHPDRSSVKQERETTSFILDERWPEFDEYVQRVSTYSSTFILPLRTNRWIHTDRYSWNSMHGKKTFLPKLREFTGR